MFENDWMVANLNNPDMDMADLTTIGELNTKNTQFLKKEDYLKSNFIKNNDMFKDENGNFSKQKFDNYYNYQASQWNKLLQGEFPKGLMLDPFDTAANRRNSRVKELEFNIGRGDNPDRVKRGIEGIRTISDRTKSISELAQSLKIYDPETNKFEEISPNDMSLLSSPKNFIQNLFKDPLVLATYDEDTEDEDGTVHKKGDYKLNKQGTYYYERLNGRDSLGKLSLSFLDILTPEDHPLNKIDFFDSDDLNKSVAGTIAKNIAFVAPLFVGGPVAAWYTRGIIAKEMMKTLPMLYNVSTGVFGDDSKTPEWINTLAAKGGLLTSGTSEGGKLNMWNIENFANLITDVALLWGLQKEIAKLFAESLDKGAVKTAEKNAYNLYKRKMLNPKLKSLGKPSEEIAQLMPEEAWKTTRLGQMALKKYYDPVVEAFKKKLQFGADMSLVYMSLISNTDVYSDMIEKGATKKEAAWVTLGSTAGMFSVDKFGKLGETFFDELADDTGIQVKKALRGTLNKAGKGIKGEIKDVIEKYKFEGEKTPKNLFLHGVFIGKKLANNFVENVKDHNLGFLGKAIGEGLEEISEEAVTDLSKATYSLLGDLGFYDPSVKNPIDYETMLDRYAMSFIGGALGGGLFYGVEKFQGRYNKSQDKDMVELIRDGKADLLRKQVKEWMDQGKLGSTTISGKDYTYSTENPEEKSFDNLTWLSTNNKEESLNDEIGRKILLKIDQLEAIIVGDGTKLNDDLLFDRMVLSDARFDQYKNASYITGYYSEFKKLQDDILSKESELRLAEQTVEGTPNGTPMTDRRLTDDEKSAKEDKLAILRNGVENAKMAMLDHLSGDSSLEYTRKLMFALDPYLNSVFLDIDYSKWAEENAPNFDELDNKQKTEIFKKYQEFVKEKMESGLDTAWDLYKKIEEEITPQLLSLAESASNYLLTQKNLEKIRMENDKFNSGKYFQDNPFTNFSDRIAYDDGTEETDEDFEHRNDKNTPDELLKYAKRWHRMENENRRKYLLFILNYENLLSSVDYKIDSSTYRAIRQNIVDNIPYIISETSKIPFINHGSIFDATKYKTLAKQLKSDFSNQEELKNKVEDIWNGAFKDESLKIINQFDAINPVKVIDLSNDSSYILYGGLRSVISSSNIENKDELLSEIDSAKERYEESSDPDEKSQILEEVKEKVNNDNLFKKEEKLSSLIEDIFFEDSDLFDDEKGNPAQTFAEVFTFQDFVDLLNQDDSHLNEMLDEKIPGLANAVRDYFSTVVPSFGKDVLISTLFDGDSQFSDFETKRLLIESAKKYIDNVVNQVKTHPLTLFLNKLLTSVKSPLQNIFESIAKTVSDNKNELSNLEFVLNEVVNDFTNSIPDQFELSPALSDLLENAKHVLELVSAYLYSANTDSNADHPFGQNHQINNFALNNSDKLQKTWNPLPEIDDNYNKILMHEVANTIDEINIWQAISSNNGMNKSKRLLETGYVSNKIKYNFLKELSKTFTIDDREYNLTDYSLPSVDEVRMKDVHTAEQKIFNNFVNILNETGLSPEEFFERSNFWETVLVGDVSLGYLNTSNLKPDMTEMTKYDKAIYLLSCLSLNPTQYYKYLKVFSETNPDIAPIPTLLQQIRLGIIANSRVYKAGLKSLAKYINPNQFIAANTMYINGVAGAGKTDVVLKAIRKYYEGDKALIIGPKSAQATKLAEQLGETLSFTVNDNPRTDLFPLLVKDYNKFRIEELSDELLSQLTGNSEDNDGKSVENDYVRLTYKSKTNSSDSGIKVELLNTVEFNPEFDLKLIFVDEAAHLNTVQLALLEAYANKVGGAVYLANDSNQSGYSKGPFENLNADAMFMTRTLKLQESLRSDNIQKQSNDNKVAAILDAYNELLDSGLTGAVESFAQQLPEMLKGLHLRVYNEEKINGDLYNANIDEIISKIPKDAKIGFVGDQNEVYGRLLSAGFTNLNSFKFDEVQGLEFDYVIIDKFDIPEIASDYSTFNTLKKLYTLMTRGKKAAIWLNDLSDIFGELKLDKVTSKGFSILNQIEIFKHDFDELIQELDLSDATSFPEFAPITTEPTPEPPPEFSIPEFEESESGISEEMSRRTSESEDDFGETPESPSEYNFEGELIFEGLTIEANTVMPITGMKEEVLLDDEGNPTKYKKWIPNKSGSKLRNISAFCNKELITGDEKMHYLQVVHSIQSAILFGGTPNNTILGGYDNFKSAWNNREILFEVREASEFDNVGIGTDLDNSFIKINGKRYIISVVCKIPNIQENAFSKPFDAYIDIALLTDPNGKIGSKATRDAIKKKLQDKIDAGTVKNVRLAQNFVDNLDESIKKYSKFVEEIVEKYPEGWSTNILDLWKSHKTTRIVKTKNKRRLGGLFNPDDFERKGPDGKPIDVKRNHGNFRDIDSRRIVSPVYILTDKQEILSGKVDESVIGKAVVFVTNDMNSDPSTLADQYILQKQDPKNSDPKVRMIVLENRGLTFSELVNNRIGKAIKEESGEYHKPWNMKVMGIRMYSALWNFRASLANTIVKVSDFLKENGITNSDGEADYLRILQIAEVEAYKYIYDSSKSEDDLQKYNEIKNRYGVSDSDLEILKRINNEVLIDVPTIRIGHDITKHSRGGYVRSFDVSKSSKYSKKNANMLVLNLQTISKYYGLSNAILDELIKTLHDEHLVLIIRELTGITDYNPNPLLHTLLIKSDGSNYSEYDYIGKSEIHRGLSGLIKTDPADSKIRITEDIDGAEDVYETDGQFEFLPKLLSSIVRRTKHYQKTGETIRSEISTIDKDDNVTKYDFNFDRFFDKGLLRKDYRDNSLPNMLNLIFHGSIEDITKPHAFTEDAPYKFGIFVDPEAKRAKNYKEINVRGKDGKDYTLLACGINDVLFNVNVDVIPGGLSLNLDGLINKFNKVSPTESTKIPENTLLNNFELLVSDGILINGMYIYNGAPIVYALINNKTVPFAINGDTWSPMFGIDKNGNMIFAEDLDKFNFSIPATKNIIDKLNKYLKFNIDEINSINTSESPINTIITTGYENESGLIDYGINKNEYIQNFVNNILDLNLMFSDSDVIPEVLRLPFKIWLHDNDKIDSEESYEDFFDKQSRQLATSLINNSILDKEETIDLLNAFISPYIDNLVIKDYSIVENGIDVIIDSEKYNIPIQLDVSDYDFDLLNIEKEDILNDLDFINPDYIPEHMFNGETIENADALSMLSDINDEIENEKLKELIDDYSNDGIEDAIKNLYDKYTNDEINIYDIIEDIENNSNNESKDDIISYLEALTSRFDEENNKC